MTTQQQTLEDLKIDLTPDEQRALCLAINEAPEGTVEANEAQLPFFRATWATACAETAIEALSDMELDDDDRQLLADLESALAKINAATDPANVGHTEHCATGKREGCTCGRTAAVDARAKRTQLDNALKAGEEAFWAAIGAAHPQIKTGDLDPMESIRFSEAARRAVEAWVETNTPDTCPHGDGAKADCPRCHAEAVETEATR